MLESIVRNNVVRYITLATTLTASAPVYAQTPEGGAYYIDPAKRRERQERKEREEREAREAAAAATPAPAPPSSPAPLTPPVVCNTAEDCFREGTNFYQKNDKGKNEPDSGNY